MAFNHFLPARLAGGAATTSRRRCEGHGDRAAGVATATCRSQRTNSTPLRLWRGALHRATPLKTAFRRGAAIALLGVLTSL